eukprot:scaffold30329_cov40-Phaeocystis_antarctica.AAC.3
MNWTISTAQRAGEHMMGSHATVRSAAHSASPPALGACVGSSSLGESPCLITRTCMIGGSNTVRRGLTAVAPTLAGLRAPVGPGGQPKACKLRAQRRW